MPFSYFKRPLCLLLISYILLLALFHAWGFYRTAPPSSWDRFLWRAIEVEGTVVSGSVEKRLGERVRIKASRLGDDVLPRTVDIFAYLPKGRSENEDLRPGQRIVLWGRLRRSRWPRNPGEFDEQGFCSDRGIALLLQAKRFVILKTFISWKWLPWSWAEAAHRSIHQMLASALPVPEASLWEGILLGYKSSLPDSIGRDVQNAGVMHLLVPSGAKMAFVLALCFWTASRIGLGPRLRALVAALMGGFYALVVGAEPPYLRAYGSALVGFIARRLERDPLGFQAVVLSAWSILLISPRELFSAGFQMTYAAILGVMIAMPRWKLPASWPAVMQTIARLFLVSFVVQLMLWPILAGIFGRISISGLAANVVLVPASGFYMGIGFAAWLLHAIFPQVYFQRLVPCLGILAGIFERACSLFAAFPGAGWNTGPIRWPWACVYYIAAFGVLAMPRWGVCWKAWVSAGLVAAVILFAGEKPAEIQVLFMDKSGAGAVLAHLGSGGDWLLASNLNLSTLRQSLAALGISRLDGALISSGQGAQREARTLRQLPIGEIDVLGTGFHRRWGRVSLASKRPLELQISLGEVCMLVGRRKTVVSDGRSQFCILHTPFASFHGVPGSCVFERIVSTRRDGAVWINFDDSTYSVDNQRERYSLGRPLL